MRQTIEGVAVRPLKKIPDERGCVYHMLRRDDPGFREFGEIYFSSAFPGVIKGWHRHRAMTLNYAVVHGRVKIVVFDSRDDSATKGHLMELFSSEEEYALITIPPGVWNAWQCMSDETAKIANCATLPHDPDEIERLDLYENDIPYDWKAGKRTDA